MASWLDKTGLTYLWGKIKSAILKDGIEYINGTQGSATGSWTGVTRDSSLYTGKTIAYRLPYAGSGNASLNLTLAGGGTTGAKEVYLNTTRATTHFGAGAVITMTYDGTRWRADSIPDTNNYDRRLHNQYVLAAANIPQYRVCVGTSAGYKPIAASVAFDLSYPILYCAAANQSGKSYAVAAGARSGSMYEAIPSINLGNNGTVLGVAKNRLVYLRGTISGNTFTLDSNEFMVCSPGETPDELYYIPIALVGDDWSANTPAKYYFAPQHEIYTYKDGGFGPIGQKVFAHTHSTYVNQNAFSNVKVGSTTVAADTTTDTLELVAGSNVTLTPDATNDKVTIAATDTTALGSMTGTLGVGHGGTGVSTLGAGVVYHSASGTGALSIATAANLVSALGTTAVNRATADASGNNIANTYYKKSELGSMFYGTCSTAAATQAKVVTCSTFTSANLVAGCSIDVKFTNAQTYNGAPTLNINSTGAKTVKMIGTTNPPQYWWQAGEMVTFVYDGTNWLTTKGGYATTTYYGPTKLSDAINSTSTTLAATANAAKKAYDRASAVIAPETGTVTLVYTGNGSRLETGTGVWKSGHVVTIHLQYSSTTAMTWNGNPNNNDVVASVPTSFAPATAMRFPMFTTADWGTYNIGYMSVQPDGKLVATSKSTTCMFGTFTFVKTN